MPTKGSAVVFQSASSRVAVIIVGVVFLEDVIEELVGEIVDEFDREDPMIEPQARPTPIIGMNSRALSWMAGMNHMPTPASVRHTACTALAPRRSASATTAPASSGRSGWR